jgi:ketosteroid isomerase-like protein
MSVCEETKKFELDAAFAASFSRDWLEAWNTHDLERVLSHYTDDAEMSSHFIILRGVDPSGKVVGKKALAEYWAPALGPQSSLRFELLNVLLGVSSIAILYKTNAGGMDHQAVEVFHFDSNGRVSRAYAHYGPLP